VPSKADNNSKFSEEEEEEEEVEEDESGLALPTSTIQSTPGHDNRLQIQSCDPALGWARATHADDASIPPGNRPGDTPTRMMVMRSDNFASQVLIKKWLMTVHTPHHEPPAENKGNQLLSCGHFENPRR